MIAITARLGEDRATELVGVVLADDVDDTG